MKDYRLRIGMRFVQQGHEFIIEGPLPDDQLKIKDTFTDVCSARTTADLLEDLFAGRLELISAGSEGKVLRDALAQRRVSDLTLLDDGDPLKVEALRRLHYVQAVFDERPSVRTRETLSPIIERTSEQIKDDNPPSWTTLKRWSRIYERSGEDVRALVPAIKARGNRRAKYSGHVIETFSAEDQQKAKEVAQIVDETIRVKYMRLERPSVTSVHESAVARIVSLNQGRAEADKLPLPHLSSIYTAVERLDPYEVAMGRYGKRYADEQFRARGEGPRPVRPPERVECDETKLDLMVIDTETRLPLGRPWLTTMIDVCTKMITGFYLSFHPPGYLSVMRCLLHAVRPKSYLKADYPQIERAWPAYGVPETLVVDNAEHFHGKNFVLACAQIGTRVEYAPPRTPQYKASIERWFGTQNRRLLHELPGTTFSNVLDRDDYDPQKHAVISIDACLELVHLWIVDIYHQTVHRGIRDIPHRRWVENIREWPPNLPPRSADLKVLIGFNAERAISPSGIELFTLRYNSPELAALRLNLKKGEKATLKYDPQDISIIYVYDQVEDRTIDVPALNQEYTRKLTIWQHHVIRKYARRIVQDCVDIEALCRAKEKIQQIVERERFLTGNMRGKQKIAHYLDLGQKISDGAPDEWETGGKILPVSASVISMAGDASSQVPVPDPPGATCTKDPDDPITTCSQFVELPPNELLGQFTIGALHGVAQGAVLSGTLTPPVAIEQAGLSVIADSGFWWDWSSLCGGATLVARASVALINTSSTPMLAPLELCETTILNDPPPRTDLPSQYEPWLHTISYDGAVHDLYIQIPEGQLNADYLSDPWPLRIRIRTNAGAREITIPGIQALTDADRLMLELWLGFLRFQYCHTWAEWWNDKVFKPKWWTDPDPPIKVPQEHLWLVAAHNLVRGESVAIHSATNERILGVAHENQGLAQLGVLVEPAPDGKDIAIVARTESPVRQRSPAPGVGNAGSGVALAVSGHRGRQMLEIKQVALFQAHSSEKHR